MPAAKGICKQCGLWLWRNFDHECTARQWVVWCDRAGIAFEDGGEFTARSPEGAAVKWMLTDAGTAARVGRDIHGDLLDPIYVQQTGSGAPPTLHRFRFCDLNDPAIWSRHG